MKPTGYHVLTAADAERLLATGEGPAALSALLSAAASPPAAARVQGVEQALAAFRSASLSLPPAPTPRSAGRWKSALTRLSVKAVAGAAVATAATGGIALAAATGTLPFQSPSPLPSQADHGVSMAASHVPTDRGSSSAPAGLGATNGSDETHGADESSGAGETPNATPSPSLPGLCHAYRVGVMNHGNVADNPAFTALIRAAKGADNVEQFCVTILGPVPTHPAEPTYPPTHTASPEGPPSDTPSHSHPEPSTHP